MEQDTTSVPSARDAREALRTLDHAQAAIVAALPGRIHRTVVTVSTLGGALLPAFTVGRDLHGGPNPIHRWPLGAVIGGGAALVVLAVTVSWLEVGRVRRSGMSSVRQRWPRAGRQRLVSTDIVALYVCAAVGIWFGSWLVGVATFAALVALDLVSGVVLTPARRRKVIPARFRRHSDTSYREFLDADVWRVAGALVLLQHARPGALARVLGLSRERVDRAIETLRQLGYVDPTKTREASPRGPYWSLNSYGVDAFRHQLAAYEGVADARGPRLVPAF